MQEEITQDDFFKLFKTPIIKTGTLLQQVLFEEEGLDPVILDLKRRVAALEDHLLKHGEFEERLCQYRERNRPRFKKRLQNCEIKRSGKNLYQIFCTNALGRGKS